MKKRIFALFMAAALCVPLAGCGSSEKTKDTTETAETDSDAFTPKLDTEEDATINVIGYLENFESLESVINDFNEYYPNCEVLYEYLGDYRGMLSTRLATDDSVGVFMTNNQYYTEESRDNYADLSKEDIDFSAVQDEAVEASKADDGKLYELPLANNTYGLIVNTTLLEEEGLSVPKNQEEFLSVCESLKEAGYTPIQGYKTFMDLGVIRNMVYINLSETYDTQEKIETLISGEEGCADVLLPAFEILDELYEKGYIDNEVNATYEDSYDKAILKFFEGDVPFLACTAETFSGTKKRESKSEHFSGDPFEYEFICTPIAEDGAYSYIEIWAGFAVNEECENKDWAVEFMRFVATKEELNELAYIKGLPSVAKESDDDRFDGIYSDNNELVYTNDNFFPAEVEDSLYNALAAYVDDDLDAEGTVDKMEELLREDDSEESES